MTVLINAIARIRADVAEHKRARATYNRVFTELSEMSSRELSDIGISRSDIEQIAQSAAQTH